jgi:ribosomal protein S18 acetylase RimI-like enzyme
MLTKDVSEATWLRLTELLHRAYAGQVAMGLRPLAGRQGVDVTRQRCGSGDTFVAEGSAETSGGPECSPIIGMILLQEVEEAAFPTWFLKPEVAHFSLLAVAPEFQGQGIGVALMSAAERRAAARGFSELALSMAEPDVALLEFYRRRGFRFVQHWRWPYTNYRSVILSRPIGAEG